MTRREQCRGVISRTLAEFGSQDERTLRQALSGAYFQVWPRKTGWRYEVWRSEVRRQRGFPRRRKRYQQLSLEPLWTEGENV
jgi:hypothetical protein